MISKLGRVAEWFKAPVLKTGVPSRVPWVRLPPLPPLSFARGRPSNPARAAYLRAIRRIKASVSWYMRIQRRSIQSFTVHSQAPSALKIPREAMA